MRGVARLEQRTLALGMLVAALGAVIGLFAWASTGGVSFGGRYPFTVILPVALAIEPEAERTISQASAHEI